MQYHGNLYLLSNSKKGFHCHQLPRVFPITINRLLLNGKKSFKAQTLPCVATSSNTWKKPEMATSKKNLLAPANLRNVKNKTQTSKEWKKSYNQVTLIFSETNKLSVSALYVNIMPDFFLNSRCISISPISGKMPAITITTDSEIVQLQILEIAALVRIWDIISITPLCDSGWKYNNRYFRLYFLSPTLKNHSWNRKYSYAC